MAQPQVQSFPIYWEKQESALCATHSVNNLLQGPYYTEIGFAEIAQSIDQRERQLMSENGTESSEYLSFMGQDSSNVDGSGNFSSEVILQSLQNFGLDCVNFNSPACADVRANTLAQTGYICNLQSHWLTLRKINDMWFNLNSLQSANDGWGPQHVSDFYLDTYLTSLQQQKYTIYVVSGSFPPVDTTVDLQNRGRWFDSVEVVDYTRNPQKLKNLQAQQRRGNKNSGFVPPHLRTGQDAALALALRNSTQQSMTGGSTVWRGGSSGGGGAASSSSVMDDEDEQLRRALQMSLQESQAAPTPPPSAAAAAAATPTPAVAAAVPLPPSASPPAAVAPDVDDEMDEEEQMRRAIEMSMQQ